ncbi:FMN-binding protein [Blautia sp. An249]|uniref:RnfABCDGE type electron transport complex subunit G n=1 Tax=Blautia sp. An249 TaxID=1965603 RepID=UPI000B3A845F|nr:RnfABCDGE type electron transport complex subunit G [Blautia sp. An249]OUO80290.1 FMN-binding protein [Blautia sp. An249]
MKNTIMKDTIILTVITLVSGFLLGLVNHITEEPIAHQQQLAKEEAYAAVFEEADSFEGVSVETDLQEYVNAQGYEAQTIDEIMEAKDASGETLGYVMTVTSSEGYGGDIQFAMGVQEDGTMNGISILSISETAGLGMKADTEEFKSQFAGVQTDAFEYTKDGATQDNQIDAISGATITTNAMTNGVNAGLAAFAYEKGGTQ